MSTQDLADYEYAHKRLSYDPDTGVLTWKEVGPEFFANQHLCAIWNTRFANKRAGSYHRNSGYRRVTFSAYEKKRILGEHRVIWLMMYGRWPNGEIDHINGDPCDNRIKNLREVNLSQNMQNKSTYSNNKTGACGVGWHKKNRVWTAYITFNSKRKHLGCYKSFEEALAVRKTAEKEYGFHENHGRR